MSPQERGRGAIVKEIGRRVLPLALRGLLTVGVVGLIAPPLFHLESTQRVLGAIVSGKVECGGDAEAQRQPYPFDAIVVPGVGNDKTTDGDYTPNKDERMRLEAAALAFLQGLAPTIILMDGPRNPRENGSVEKTYLQSFFRELTGGAEEIADETVILGMRSINTATAMDELARIARRHNIGKVLIITNSYHQMRATLLACENGVAASSQSAESILTGQNFQRYDSWTMIVTRLKEELEIIWAIWDPKGIVPTMLKIMVSG